MSAGLFIASIIGTCIQGIKEALTPEVPAENWANTELYYQDMADGVPIEKQMKYLEQGRYKLTPKHPEPHRDPVDGKIVIENYPLYLNDLMEYGAVQTMKLVEQGKYNLTPEELKKEEERIRKKYQGIEE